jgi:hypothetical protein
VDVRPLSLRRLRFGFSLLRLHKEKGGTVAPPYEMPAKCKGQAALLCSKLLGLAFLSHELQFALFGFLGCGDLFLHLLRCFFQLW